MFTFRYDPPVSRETIARWQAALDELFPPCDRLSRLLIRWEPGDAWQPIQRFIIWQAEDVSQLAIPPLIKAALNGPHPRSTGHYCSSGIDPHTNAPWCMCAIKRNGWKGGANPFLDRATWELYRETGYFGRRWWTIQGEKGGHRFLWGPNEYESKLSQMAGGPAQTPAPGDLGFAPFDQRVLERLAPLDKVRAWSMMLDYADRNADQLDAEEDAEALAIRAALWKHVDWGIEEAWEVGGSAFKQYLRELGRAPVGQTDDFDYEFAEQQFHDVA